MSRHCRAGGDKFKRNSCLNEPMNIVAGLATTLRALDRRASGWLLVDIAVVGPPVNASDGIDRLCDDSIAVPLPI
jgi:hypothetical protein